MSKVTVTGPTFTELLQGRFAPRDRLLGYTSLGASDGSSEFVWEPTEVLGNSTGIVQGGLIAAVIDDVAGTALSSHFNSLIALPTIDMQLHFLRSVPIPGRYRCVGTVVRAGRRIGVADGHIYGETDRLLVRGTCTFTLGALDGSVASAG